jgi:hypothetical protein
MEAILKNRKIVTGRLAELFCQIGIAKPNDGSEFVKSVKKPVKRVAKPKVKKKVKK